MSPVDLRQPPSIEQSNARGRPEHELLLACARSIIDPGTAQRMARLLEQPIDWPYLTETAKQHAVTPLLYHSLSTTYPQAVPVANLDALRLLFHANALHNRFLARKLVELVSRLESQEISVIAFKGPVLAASIYGDLALRQFADLDFLVHERDYEPTRKRLTALGYRLHREHGWESHFKDASGRVNVDVHKGIAPPAFPAPLDFERLWERRTRVNIEGTTVCTLSREDLLIVLCVQAAKDRWEGQLALAKLCDIAQLLQAHPNMQWDAVMEQAAGSGNQRMLCFGLSLVHELFGTALPSDVVQRIEATRFVHALVRSTCRRLSKAPKRDYSDIVERIGFHFAVRERWSDKIAQLRMVSTKLGEWRASKRSAPSR